MAHHSSASGECRPSGGGRIAHAEAHSSYSAMPSRFRPVQGTPMWNLLLALAPALQDPATEQIYHDLQKVDRINPVVLVAQAVTPAVVYIQTEITGRVDTFWGSQQYRGVGAGSGVVVRPE